MTTLIICYILFWTFGVSVWTLVADSSYVLLALVNTVGFEPSWRMLCIWGVVGMIWREDGGLCAPRSSTCSTWLATAAAGSPNSSSLWGIDLFAAVHLIHIQFIINQQFILFTSSLSWTSSSSYSHPVPHHSVCLLRNIIKTTICLLLPHSAAIPRVCSRHLLLLEGLVSSNPHDSLILRRS